MTFGMPKIGWVGAAALIAGLGQPAAAEGIVTFAGWGGTTSEAQIEELFGASADLGIDLASESHGGWPGIKAYLQSGAEGWDIVSVGFSSCEQASQAGLLAPLDYDVIDASQVNEDLVHENYIGAFTFAYAIAYQDKYKDNPPTTWADFWDVETFPGRRSLPSHGTFVLEAALMADGVAPGDVYSVLETPEGLEQAFAKVEEIKPHIDVWYTSTGQLTELVRTGEIELAIFPNGRASVLTKDGSDIGYEWNQGLIDTECLMIPASAPNKEGAMELINAALDPASQARFAARSGYGPVNPAAFDDESLADPEVSMWLPTESSNLSKMIYSSAEWYASAAAEDAYLRFGKLLQ
ncbi:MAG: ABC transporter substrate-binding protein [Pseudomonadota bacterium]|nr:ABC transporter substrate-binding protein [Pseudomonadota bacterium]